LGGQAVDLVMVVTNQSGMDHLLASKFKLGADASAAAGPVGRDAGADTDIKMRSEVLTYSRARGLFAGVDLSGAAITQDKDETRLLYGKFIPFPDILTGKVEAPAASEPFLAAVRKYSAQSKESSKSSQLSGTFSEGQ
jgi:lipid-binding SYLF domain-containing protein